MSTYAIGDVQGCYDSLRALLDIIHFNEHDDTLWFTGDLISRGPKSLSSLRFIKNLQSHAITVLGNHDLSLLAVVYAKINKHHNNSLDELLGASDRDELCDWLRRQPLLHHDNTLNYTMTHAGIYPFWDLAVAQQCAKEVEHILQSEYCTEYFKNMYGNEPSGWSDQLTHFDRLRFITNAFTRMRVCTTDGHLNLEYKGDLDNIPQGLLPWYAVPDRVNCHLNIIFGHWAALDCKVNAPNLHPLDSGCCWGKQLTALCLETKERFQVLCREKTHHV
jgi:bis(5'-nucleosyl)-tetraphosphatase (symmetrical)